MASMATSTAFGFPGSERTRKPVRLHPPLREEVNLGRRSWGRTTRSRGSFPVVGGLALNTLLVVAPAAVLLKDKVAPALAGHPLVVRSCCRLDRRVVGVGPGWDAIWSAAFWSATPAACPVGTYS
ncbi:hypothetical protein E2562_023706 [Oryza meyeriana var. granulata]|uniref:Uncharacterized protein n=1 Tax=Oryza meyeriana var. granulata TaxID=110450 RepID=A0A6G1BN65_9ORYZ|nr:hypothetical protein E2562_023706 [Oryza meyeriana var. granulata]